MLDAVIVGAGPAGCSAAAWLAMLGLRATLIEREPHACASLAALSVGHSWVLGALDSELAELARRYASDLAALRGVDLRTGHALEAVDRVDDSWRVRAGGDRFDARCFVVATGAKPRRPAKWFAHAGGALLDPIGLTQQREHREPARTLLLGGGDNAVENAAYLAERGHKVTLWSRSALHAQPALAARLAELAHKIDLREREPMPRSLVAGNDHVEVQSAAHGDETFRMAAVLFGFEPRSEAHRLACDALQRAGTSLAAQSNEQPYAQSAAQANAALPEAPAAGLFVAGDASARWHPCVQTALADGVRAAKAVQRHTERR